MRSAGPALDAARRLVSFLEARGVRTRSLAEERVGAAEEAPTSQFADGNYGVTYLTAPALVDFRGGTAIVQWDMSTQRTSLRDWVDVWITPYGQQLQLEWKYL